MDEHEDRHCKCEHFDNFKYHRCNSGWKPITHSKFYAHRHHKRTNRVNQISNTFKQTQPKGLIFVWPQKRKFRYEREMFFLTWFLAHGLYWLHLLNLFPNGSGMLLDQPPWKYTQPLPTPQSREYIIEPDWDSAVSK